MTMFNRDINRAFGEYLQYNRRSRPDLLRESADKLAAQLQIEAAKEGPGTRAEIAALPTRLGYRIRRRLAQGLSKNPNRKGNKSLAATIERGASASGRQHVTVAEEIQLRLRWAGFYQASGWITSRLTLSAGRTRIARPRGRIITHMAGSKPAITLVNQTPGALEFANKTRYMLRAIRARIADMQTYVQRKMKEQAAEFSKPKPNFQRRVA